MGLDQAVTPLLPWLGSQAMGGSVQLFDATSFYRLSACQVLTPGVKCLCYGGQICGSLLHGWD